ncbi:hypothetical protein KR009_002215 [Drosophila setifemur]|nr:hypothetical protein KR009_002215 [Drosophila setifemur]
MTNYGAKKAFLLLSLLLLESAQANPIDRDQDMDQHVRKERQLKGSSTDADVKMMANVTPAVGSQPMAMGMGLGMGLGMPMNQMALNAVGGQLLRYPNYADLIYPGPTPGLNGFPGLQTNIANNYPSYVNPNLAGPVSGFGSFAPFGYPGSLPPMYGNNLAYPNPQLPNGFVPQPSVDNFQALNNVVNMANVQGLGSGNSGFYPAPQPLPVQVNMQGLYPAPAGGFLERMSMQAYAPGF